MKKWQTQNSACSSEILLKSQAVSIIVGSVVRCHQTQPLKLPASISVGFVLSENTMLQFSPQGNCTNDACLPLGEEGVNKTYLWL